jgi:hypothetical protein
VVILAVPWQAMDETLGQLGDLPGTVVVDVSYPYTKRERKALKGTSTAEMIQKRLSTRRCSRLETCIRATLDRPAGGRDRLSVLIAGDDQVVQVSVRPGWLGRVLRYLSSALREQRSVPFWRAASLAVCLEETCELGGGVWSLWVGVGAVGAAA